MEEAEEEEKSDVYSTNMTEAMGAGMYIHFLNLIMFGKILQRYLVSVC